MQKGLKDFSEVELKALVYDNIAQIEKNQANIKIINQELANRGKKEVAVAEPEEPASTVEG